MERSLAGCKICGGSRKKKRFFLPGVRSTSAQGRWLDWVVSRTNSRKKVKKVPGEDSGVEMACFAKKTQRVHLCGAHHENGRRRAHEHGRRGGRWLLERLAGAGAPIRARGHRGVGGCAKIDKIKKVRRVLVVGVTAPPSQIQPPSPLIFASLYIKGVPSVDGFSKTAIEGLWQGGPAPKTRKKDRNRDL